MRRVLHKTDQFDWQTVTPQRIGYLDGTETTHTLTKKVLKHENIFLGSWREQETESSQTLVAVSTQVSSEEEMMAMWAHLK